MTISEFFAKLLQNSFPRKEARNIRILYERERKPTLYTITFEYMDRGRKKIPVVKNHFTHPDHYRQVANMIASAARKKGVRGNFSPPALNKEEIALYHYMVENKYIDPIPELEEMRGKVLSMMKQRYQNPHPILMKQGRHLAHKIGLHVVKEEAPQPRVQKPQVQKPTLNEKLKEVKELEKQVEQKKPISQPNAANIDEGAEELLTAPEEPILALPPGKDVSAQALPPVEQPIVEQPAVKQPAVEEPVIEQPVVEEPVVEQPRVEQPVVEQPVVEEPVEEPVTEQPVIEEPIEEPAAEEHGGFPWKQVGLGTAAAIGTITALYGGYRALKWYKNRRAAKRVYNKAASYWDARKEAGIKDVFGSAREFIGRHKKAIIAIAGAGSAMLGAYLFFKKGYYGRIKDYFKKSTRRD